MRKFVESAFGVYGRFFFFARAFEDIRFKLGIAVYHDKNRARYLRREKRERDDERHRFDYVALISFYVHPYCKEKRAAVNDDPDQKVYYYLACRRDFAGKFVAGKRIHSEIQKVLLNDKKRGGCQGESKNTPVCFTRQKEHERAEQKHGENRPEYQKKGKILKRKSNSA